MAVPTSSVTYRGSLGGNPATPASLAHYLRGIQTEEWNAEFKHAAEGGDYQIRKAIASMGNRAGGEVFIGVRDSDRTIVGTTMNRDALYAVLGQRGTPGEWYAVDLVPSILLTTEVQLSDPGKWAIVAEVRRAVFPGLVVEDDGTLTWYERRGGTDHRLTAYEGVEARRRYERGKLLMELYYEYRSAVIVIPEYLSEQGPVGPRFFSLPRFKSALADGTFYSTLTAEDRALLLVSDLAGPNQPGSPGLLRRFIKAGEVADAQSGLYPTPHEVNGALEQSLRTEKRNVARELVQFENYLRSLGVPLGRAST